MRIIQEHDKCIGCGACTVVCPSGWEMGEDGKARPKEAKFNSEKNIYEKEIKEAGCNKAASDSCPVDIIHIEE
jgi:ferredoxin